MIKNFIFNNVSIKLFNILIAFVIAIFTNRVLGPEGRGVLATVLTWNSLFYTIFFFSLHIGIYKVFEEIKYELSEILTTTLTIGICVGVISVLFSTIIFYLLPELFGSIEFKYLLVGFLIIPIMIIQNILMAILQMQMNLHQYNIIEILQSIIMLLVTIPLLILSYYNIEWALFIFVFSIVVKFIYTILLFNKDINFKNSINVSLTKKILVYGATLHISTISTFLYSKIDILMINMYLDEVQTGIYFLALMVSSTFFILPSVVQTVLYPKLNTISGNGVLYFFKASRIIAFIMFILVLLTVLFADYIVLVLGGKEFEESVTILRILLLSTLFMIPSIIMAPLWVKNNYFKHLNFLAVSSIFVAILLNIIFIPRYGIIGAAISTLFVYVYLFIMNNFLIFKLTKKIYFLEYLVIKGSDMIYLLNILKFRKDKK